MSEEQEDMDFETLLRHLEEVVTRLEGGELTLEASLQDYEQGLGWSAPPKRASTR